MIKYVKVKRLIQVGANPGLKYLARLFRSNDVTMDQLCEEISESTTVSYPDVLACLKALEITVSRHVMNGEAVKFAYLGSFIPAIKAKAQDELIWLMLLPLRLLDVVSILLLSSNAHYLRLVLLRLTLRLRDCR